MNNHKLKIFLFIVPIIIGACGHNNKSMPEREKENPAKITIDTLNEEVRMTARFNSFDTTAEVLFWDTKDSISDTQKKNYEGFISKQEMLTPEILKKVFEFYKSSYLAYKEGWTMVGNITSSELENYLPTPTTPENLKPFFTPAIIHIQNKKDCKEGTIGIEFDCTWDIKSGLGISIRDWKVVEASVAEIAYFLP